MAEMLVLVNDKDEVIGEAPRPEVIKNKLLHRTVNIFVRNSKGEILATKRAPNVDTNPNLIDARVAGRVPKGESYEQTAIRELREEIGAENVKIKFLFKKLQPKFFSFRQVYECVYDGKITPQKEELAWAKFVKVGELKEMMKKENFHPAAKELLGDYFKHET